MEKPSDESTEKSNDESTEKPESPAIGDSGERMVWILLLIFSAAELTGVYYSKRKKSDK